MKRGVEDRDVGDSGSAFIASSIAASAFRSWSGARSATSSSAARTRVVDNDRLAEACAAVDDTVRGRVDLRVRQDSTGRDASSPSTIERAAAEAGRPLPERELLARTNARHWGPGVARRALRRAVLEGYIERNGSGYVSHARGLHAGGCVALIGRRARRCGATPISRMRKSPKPATA